MKKLLLISFIFIFPFKGNAQPCDLHTFYAFCNDSLGKFELFPCYFNNGYTFNWSTGSTDYYIQVPVGYYSVTVTDAVSHDTYVWDSLEMYHAPLHFVALDMGGPCSTSHDIEFTAWMDCYQCMRTHPSCRPDSFQVILWSDSVSVDTQFVNVNNNGDASGLFCVVPGHCYDLTLYDYRCNCSYSTWKDNQTVCIAPDNVPQLSNNYFKVLVTPNPFTNQISVKFNSQKEQNISLSIYDIVGRVIKKEKLFARTGINTFEFKEETLSDGVYYLIIDNGTIKDFQQIIKIE